MDSIPILIDTILVLIMDRPEIMIPVAGLVLVVLSILVRFLSRGSADAEASDPPPLRRSVYRPRRAPGDAWPVRCKACGGIQQTRGGACAGCGEPMLPTPTHAPVPTRGGGRDLLLLLPCLAWYFWPVSLGIVVGVAQEAHEAREIVSATVEGSRRYVAVPGTTFERRYVHDTVLVPKYRTLGFSWERDVLAPGVVGGGLLGLLFGLPVFHFMGSLPRAAAAMRALVPIGRTRGYDPGARLERSWSEIKTLRGRRGLAVHVGVGLDRHAGAPLEMTVRVRGPDGHYLASTLAAYRGPFGELVRQHRTQPVRNQPARFPDLWVYFPTRTLPLSRWAAPVELVAEVLLTSRGAVLLEHDLPITFVPDPEDLPLLISRPASRPAPDATTQGGPPQPTATDPDLSVSGVDLLGDGGPAEDLVCQICGGELGEDAVPCSGCQTPHHGDCWEFMGRCSTYGCEGGAGK